MELHDLVAPEAVISGLKANSKKHALQLLCAKAADVTGLNERDIFTVVFERERLGTTGVGQGIAIPHGKLNDVDKVVGVFAQLAKAVDFEAIDNQPVDLIFLLLAPDHAGADHLKALARVSRLLRNADMCQKLRGGKDADALYALLTQKEAHAA